MIHWKPKYAIDTCSLTELRRTYPKDVFPGVWDKVGELAETGTLISIENVYEELKVQDDEVLEWADEHSEIFKPLDEQIQIETREILEEHPNLIDLKRRKSGADPFLIATAMVFSCSVVTEEKPSGGPNRSKIPDVCRANGIGCIRLLEMLRAEQLCL